MSRFFNFIGRKCFIMDNECVLTMIIFKSCLFFVKEIVIDRNLHHFWMNRSGDSRFYYQPRLQTDFPKPPLLLPRLYFESVCYMYILILLWFLLK